MSERLTITVSDDHADRIDDVVSRLEGDGVQVEKVLRTLGVVIGSIESATPRALADLTRLLGVHAVEPDRTVRLPPPDSDVQ